MFKNFRQVAEDINNGQLEPPPQGDSDQFEALNKEGRDRDYQVCQAVPLLIRPLKIYSSSSVEFEMANIHAVARFPSTAAKDIWSVSTAFRRVKKCAVRGSSVAGPVTSKTWSGT